MGTYKKFCLMLLVSLIIMYGAMFLNVDKSSDIYLSTTRLYMSLLMVCPMAVMMLAFMKHMYMNRNYNAAIIIISVLIFTAALTALRTQFLISDEQYMKAMIPHHSSAILTSKHASIQDPEVKRLSESIIRSQEREIEMMKSFLNKK